MILVCPECSTHYEIPSALPEEGTKVRCTSCTHVWMATSDDVFENAALAEESAKAKEAIPEEAEVGIPAISPNDEDPLEELDFEEIEEEIAGAGEELDQAEMDSLFEEMGVEPEPEPDPEEENSQGDIDSLFDEMGNEPEEENSQGDIDSLFDEMGDEESEENSQDDIDGLFDEPETAQEEENSQDDIDGLFDEPSGDEGEENSQDDIDGLFDEEPAETPEDEAPPAEEPLAASEEELEDPFDNEIEEVDDQPIPIAEPVNVKSPIWKRMSREEMIGWGSYGLSIVLVFAIVIFARVSIVKAIPSMAGVYSVLGMDVNVRGLTFTNVQQKWVIEENRLLLKVQGEVTNLTNRYKTLPPMVFGAVGTDKKEIFRWVMRVRKKPLLPGEKAPFMAMVPLPPKQAKHLYISFQ